MRWTIAFWFAAMLCASWAQSTNNARRLPPPGIPVPTGVRASLEGKLRQLQAEIAAVDARPKADWHHLHLPDALVYEKAVRYALEHNEFYRTNEFAMAEELIAEGLRRIRAIGAEGVLSAPWTERPELVVRGYRSKIDGSVQPYGLVIPPNYDPRRRHRVDVWLHGRDERLTELKFIFERSTKAGEFTPADTIVLHPYGRYCNAFKFAGETDVFEALENLELRGASSGRAALRGFSMGGAGVWHLAGHYPDRWVVAAPGAGFAETARYMRLNVDSIAPWERLLWQWYDATDYAANFFNTPVVAYSGELDRQKQAADVMAEALAREGLPMIHLVGPKTEHKYEPETKKLLNDIVDTLSLKRKEEFPREVWLTTRTLRYPQAHWLILTGLEKHWERADARGTSEGSFVRLWLTNVTGFALDFQRLRPSFISVEVNGERLGPRRDATNLMFFARSNGAWSAGTWPGPMRKSPGMQGPIDDAFMDAFAFVPPAGGFDKGFSRATSEWVKREHDRAVFEWRAQFRGEARVVRESEAEEEAKRSNLILWGDPLSNGLIRKLLPELPLRWSAERIELGDRSFDARTHVPVMIFPNPLNPQKYIVLNSGFTFRGFGSNADQTPKLPDYAVCDATAADFQSGVKTACFFNEQWGFDAGRNWR